MGFSVSIVMGGRKKDDTLERTKIFWNGLIFCHIANTVECYVLHSVEYDAEYCVGGLSGTVSLMDRGLLHDYKAKYSPQSATRKMSDVTESDYKEWDGFIYILM